MRVDFVPAWVGHDWCPAVIRKIKKIQSGSIISFKKLTKEGNEFLKDYFLPEGPINISDTLIFYRDVDDNFFEFIQYQLESDIMVKQLGFKEQKVLENPLIAENIELIQKGKRFKAQYRGNKHGQYHVVHLLGIEEPKVCLVESFSGKSSNKMIHLDVEKFELDVEVKYVTPNAIYFKEV